MLVEVRVQSLGLDRTTNTPVVILQELEGTRVLPIWIGPGEASAIAMHMAEMEFVRPLTHDLLVSVLKGLGGSVKKVIITRVEDSTYFAELIVHQNGHVLSLDARPSDSIALALRVNAKIFADNDLLERTAVEISDGEAALDQAGEGDARGDLRHEMGPEELKEHLRRLNPEDFGRFTP
ncbi:MAG TPA: bifunctional nuclease family protein [Longimicrobiales bacterium]|nr:bifunctional nuclease family protein [Longimicrobiales bacterium]